MFAAFGGFGLVRSLFSEVTWRTRSTAARTSGIGAGICLGISALLFSIA